MIAAASHGFGYLQCQGADEACSSCLLYHLVAMAEVVDGQLDAVREVRLKVFSPRKWPSVPTLYSCSNGADWQERETFDVHGVN